MKTIQQEPCSDDIEWYISGPKWLVLSILIFAAMGFGAWIGVILRLLGWG